MKKVNFMLLLTALLSGVSCQDADMVVDWQGCGTSSKVVKRAKDQRGILSYNEMEDTYTISVAIPRTYDSVDVGLVCNLPEKYKIPNKEGEITWVIFSGKYGEAEKAHPIPGATYYYLELSKIEFEGG